MEQDNMQVQSGLGGGEIAYADLSADRLLSQNFEQINSLMAEMQNETMTHEVERESSMGMAH